MDHVTAYYAELAKSACPDGSKAQWVAVNSSGWEWRVTPWVRGSWVSLRRSPSGYPFAEHVHREWIRTVQQLGDVIVDEMMSMLPGSSGPAGADVRDEAFAKDYPRVWWMMTQETLPDKKTRKRASLSLSFQADGWTLFLNDKQSDHYLCRSGGTIEDCLVAVELALGDQPVAWRTNGKPGKRR